MGVSRGIWFQGGALILAALRNENNASSGGFRSHSEEEEAQYTGEDPNGGLNEATEDRESNDGVNGDQDSRASTVTRAHGDDLGGDGGPPDQEGEVDDGLEGGDDLPGDVAAMTVV